MATIKDFRFRDTQSPGGFCGVSFMFRDTPDLSPTDCSFDFRDLVNEIPGQDCGGDDWIDPDGAQWVDPDGGVWQAI